MKLALGFAAALSLAATAGAQAETIILSERAPAYVVEPAPTYVAPRPLVNGYIVTDSGYVTRAPGYVVVAPPPTVVDRSYILDRSYAMDRAYVIDRSADWIVRPRVYDHGMIDVRFGTPGTCVLDTNGFERCY